jgi:hypothetical protein
MNIPQASNNVQRILGPGLPVGTGQVQQPFAIPSSYFSESPSGLPAWDTLAMGAFAPAKPSIVRVGGLWLFQETVRELRRAPWSRSPLDIARSAAKCGLSRITELARGMLTQHAMMVAWGEFADEIGLIDDLNQVSIPQKSVVHTPQAKVLTFLMGILTGITHLKDLNEGPHPLAHDWPAIRAWRLASLAHYTGISRTLAACDEKTREVHLLRRQGSPLIVDLDLAPRRVSNTSTTYPDAEFGWQGNEVGLGYDAALAALTSPSYGRLFLSGFHHPRNTVSLPRLQKMVCTAEKALGCRPRRRTELTKRRLQELNETIVQRQDWIGAQLEKRQTILARLKTLPEEVGRLEDEVAALEAAYHAQDRPERKHCHLAKAGRRLASVRKTLERAPRQLHRAEQATATHRKRLAKLETERAELVAHLAALQADNERNANPVTIILRVDAGFGTGPNIT